MHLSTGPTLRIVDSLSLALAIGCLMACIPNPAIAQSDPAQRGSAKTGSADDEYLAISLLMLKSHLQDPQAARLYGATRLYGFVLTDNGGERDCILLTDDKPGRPGLRLDDFSVAWRNVTESPQTRPACTINPRPETIASLASLAQTIQSAQGNTTVEPQLKEWERLTTSPQDVIVYGVDPDTHFAQVMVEADYFMKSICNGAATIDGITGLSKIVAQKARKEIEGTNRLSMTGPMYNRFWFNPDRVSLFRTNENGTVILVNCPVVLLTEEEAATPTGDLGGKSRPHPDAKKFADDFTKRYKNTAKTTPIYRELENLYRFVAVADILDQTATDEESRRTVVELVRDVPIERHHFEATIPGKYSLEQIEGSKSVAQGTLRYTLWLPSCGGVSIDLHVHMSEDRVTDSQRWVPAVTRAVLSARPSRQAVSWKFRSQALRLLVQDES